MKTVFNLFFICIAFLLIAFKIQFSSGYVGATEKDGGQGCNCHGDASSPEVNLWIEGPDSISTGSSANYRLFLTGGSKVAGGFNLTARKGKVYPLDNSTKLLHFAAGDSQLTHNGPLLFSGRDTISWSFRYVAPNTAGLDTIFSVANSANRNFRTDGDRWNFGRRFSVRIHSNPIKVDDKNTLIPNFVLYQNYPNPFNPTTTIKYNLTAAGNVSLKVFDALGNELSTLVEGFQSEGTYEVKFIADDINFSSGIYFYQLKAANHTETKKMILLR